MRAATALRLVLWIAAAAGVFLAFGWPFVVSSDPAGGALHVAGIATVTAFLVALGACACIAAARRHAQPRKD